MKRELVIFVNIQENGRNMNKTRRKLVDKLMELDVEASEGILRFLSLSQLRKAIAAGNAWQQARKLWDLDKMEEEVEEYENRKLFERGFFAW